jgi:RNA polymerase sigma-70 factor (ECF subfamily)
MTADAARAGPTREEVFLGLMSEHRRDLKAFVWSVVWDRALGEDILQESALVLWKRFDEYDPARPFGAWARGVTAKLVLQGLARRRREAISFAPDTIDALVAAHDRAAERAPEPAAEQAALRGCIEKLPERSRRLLHLRYEDALKLEAIAVRVSSTPAAVRMALTRMRDGLRRCIERRMRLEGEA